MAIEERLAAFLWRCDNLHNYRFAMQTDWRDYGGHFYLASAPELLKKVGNASSGKR